MNWEAIGAIAELLGAVGVIATLGYLAVQIRMNTDQMSQNTESTRATTETAAMSEWIGFTKELAKDPDLSDLWHRGIFDDASLSPEEARRFGVLVVTQLNIFRSAFYQHRRGILGDEFWAPWDDAIRLLFRLPGYRAVAFRTTVDVLEDPFAAHLRSHLAEQDGSFTASAEQQDAASSSEASETSLDS